MLLAKFLYKAKDNKHSIPLLCREKKSLDQIKESPMKMVVQERGGGSPMSALSMAEGAGVHDEPLLSGFGYLTQKNHLKVSTKTPLGHPLC